MPMPPPTNVPPPTNELAASPFRLRARIYPCHKGRTARSALEAAGVNVRESREPLDPPQNPLGAEPPSRYPEWMRVTVLYFGVLRDRFGVADQVVELADGAAVGDLLRILRDRTSNHAMAGTVERDEQLWR